MATINGTSGDDTILGSPGDTISGLDGDDTITVYPDIPTEIRNGLGPITTIHAGNGNNTISVGNIDASIVVGNGNNIIDVSSSLQNVPEGTGTAIVYIGTDIQGVVGITLGSGQNTIVADAPAELTVSGFNISSDTFEATEPPADASSGRFGDDIEYKVFSDGSNTILVNSQSSLNILGDYISYDAPPNSFQSTLLPTNSADESVITLLGVNAGDFAAAGYKGVLAGPVGIAGTSGNDVLVGTSSADDFFGGAGADTFLYRASSDSTPSAYDVITDFQTGQDVIDLTAVHASSVSLVRSGSATFLFAETPTGPMTIAADGPINGNDVVTGGTNHGGIYLVGDDDGDMLTGSAQGDAIQGGAYDDLITGGGGGDVLTGGGGANTFAYQAASDSTASAPDFITDFQSGQDKIDLTVVPVSHISTIDDGAATFVFVETSQGEMQINVQGAVEAGDILTTGLINFYEIGDSDNNTLIGGAGNDVLQGGSGNETLIGGGASDALFGGPGADTFTYLAASDSNAGGFDTIFDFQTGIDKIDLAAVNPTHVSVLVDGAAEFLFINVPGAAMEIAVVGSVQAADVITGSSTTPFYIVGDDNAHTLIGGGGPDVIAGGAGNDIIIGGGGTDALYGGAGKDTFKYLAASDSTTSTPDTIFDFQTGIDKIDLSAIHTSSKDVINILVSGNASYLYIDQGGDGVNDMLIQIANPNLHATDIVW